MSRYAILGGGGVFAIHFAKYLLEQKDTENVLSIGRNPPKSEAFTLGIGKGDPRYKYEQVHIVFEQDRLFELFDRYKPEYIVNFAAQGFTVSWEKSFLWYETNVVALVKICEQFTKRNYLKRFVHIGTSELYGPVSRPADETYPVNPTTPYAVSKLAADMHLNTLWKAKSFPMNIIRPSNAHAPGQQLYRILPKAVYCGLTGKKVPLEGGGVAKKSYMHAYDLARAIFMLLEKGRLGEVYNVGPDEPVTIRYLVELVAQKLNLKFEDLAELVPGRKGEDSQYWLDSSKIKSELGYKETISLEQGVDDMINWGRKYLDLLHDESQVFVLRA